VLEARRRGRDARVKVQVVPAAERYVGSVGTAPEPGPGGDPEDDGREFFSAGWGNGHEGAGIEILDVDCASLSALKAGRRWKSNVEFQLNGGPNRTWKIGGTIVPESLRVQSSDNLKESV
jgi:hypothetical protein